MMEKLKKGFYAKPGGYDLFCKDLEDIGKKYNSQAKKEVKVIPILDNITRHDHFHPPRLVFVWIINFFSVCVFLLIGWRDPRGVPEAEVCGF